MERRNKHMQVAMLKNIILIKPLIKKTQHQGRPNISFFHPLGCECFILNTKDQLAKLIQR